MRVGREAPARAVAWAVLALACASGSAANAEEGCDTTKPWVRLAARGALPRGFDRSSFLERLRVELAGRGISLCSEPAARSVRPPVADVDLGPDPEPVGGASARVSLDIEVRDKITAKRVARVIDLSGVPADGRGVVVALAVDDLLRASWAELALRATHTPPPAAPPELRAAVAPSHPTPGPVAVGLRAAGEVWSAGSPLVGGDGVLAWHPARRVAIDLVAGARVAPDSSSERGTVSLGAFTLRAGAAFGLRPAERSPAVLLGARVGGYVLRLTGEGIGAVRGTSATEVAVAAELGPRLELPLGSGVRLVAEADVGVAMRGVQALELGNAVGGVSGVAGMLALGVAAGGGS